MALEAEAIADEAGLSYTPPTAEEVEAGIVFSLRPDAVGKWVNRQTPLSAPILRKPRGGEAALRQFAKEQWDRLPSAVVAHDGTTVVVKHNRQGTEEVLLEHLITDHGKAGGSHVSFPRVMALAASP